MNPSTTAPQLAEEPRNYNSFRSCISRYLYLSLLWFILYRDRFAHRTNGSRSGAVVFKGINFYTAFVQHKIRSRKSEI